MPLPTDRAASQRLTLDPSAPPSSSLILKLRRRDRLTAEEEQILRDLIPAPTNMWRGADLVSEHDRPTNSILLVEGMAARYQVLDGGGRQVTSLHLPGDFVDLHSLLLKRMDHGVVALTDCRIASVPHADLRKVTETQPHLSRLLWLTTLIDGAIHRDWLVSMGRRPARGHMAHLFCELYCLLDTVQLAPDHSFLLPIPQTDLADILGLSAVHVNRVLQELRAAELVDWRGGKLTILDWDRLAREAEFDDTYLQLTQEPR